MSDKNKNIQVIEILNPLDPAAKRFSTLDYTAGKTLQDIYPLVGATHATVLSINGKIVQDADRERTYPQAGDVIVSCPVLAGGGGGGKSVLRIAALIAVAVFAPYATTALIGINGAAALGAVGVSMVTAGITIAGGMLVNALLPAPTTAASSTTSADDTTTYGNDGPLNASAEGLPVPVIYGVHRYGGNLINAYTTADGDTQWLHMLFNCGEGPISGITDVELDDTPIESYADYQVETRTGEQHQDPISFFVGQTIPISVSKQLTTSWTYQATEAKVDKLRFDFTFTSGLYRLSTKSGDYSALGVDIVAEYRLKGSTNDADWKPLGSTSTVSGYTDNVTWQSFTTTTTAENGDSGPQDYTTTFTWVPGTGERLVGTDYYGPVGGAYEDVIVGRVGQTPNFSTTWTVSANQRTPLRRSFFTEALPEAEYETRVRRTRLAGKDDAGNTPDGAEYADAVTWVELNQIQNEVVQYPNTALLGIRIKLGDQLNGLPSVTHLNHGRKVKVWKADQGLWLETNSNNPAWITLDAQTNKRYGGGIATARHDLAMWKEWAAYCDSANLTFDGIFDTQTNLWDAMTPVYRAGHAGRTNVGTRYSVAIERAEASKMMFTVANMISGTFKQTWLPATDRANELEITWIDKTDGYKQKTMRVVDTTVVNRDPKSASVDMTGLVEADKVWRDANILLNQNRLLLQSIEWSSPIEAIACRPGDVVTVQHDMPAWSKGGRAEAGSTASVLKLDRPVSMSPGVAYSALVHFPAIGRHSAPIAFIYGNAVYIDGYTGATNVKRAKVNGRDIAIDSVVQLGGSYGVALADVDGLAAGMNIELWDTDAIESRVVLNQIVSADEQVTELTLASPFPAAIPQYAQWMFGQLNRTGKLFRIKSITGTHEYRRDLTALEYNADAYQATPAPATPNYSELGLDVKQAIIDSVDEEAFTSGSAIKSRVTVHYHGADDSFFSAAVYVSRNGAAEESLGNDGSKMTVEASIGDTLAFRVVARDAYQRSAPRSTAPTITITTQGRAVLPGDATGVAVALAGDAWQVTWDAPTDPAINATEVRIDGTSWADARQLYRGASATTSATIPLQAAGEHTLRVRHCIGQVDGLYSGNDGLKSLTVLPPDQPVVTGENGYQQVSLGYQNCQTTQPLASYTIYKGKSLATAVMLGVTTSSVFTFSEPDAGAFTYWVVATDKAGNAGAPGYKTMEVLGAGINGGDTFPSDPKDGDSFYLYGDTLYFYSAAEGRWKPTGIPAVDELPDVATARDDDTVMLDGTMYIFAAGAWKTITATIAAGSVDMTKLADGLEVVSIVDGLPAAYLTSIVYDTVTRKTYRWDGAAYTAAVATVDLVGTIDAAQIAEGAITNTKLADDLSAVVSYPGVPSGYLDTDTVYDTVAKKLLYWDGAKYTAAVATTDLIGTISADQVANGVIDDTKLASNLSAVVTTGVQPGTVYLGSPSVYFNGKLYTWNAATGYSTAVQTVDLVGTISAAQLATGAVDATKVAAGLDLVVSYAGVPTAYMGAVVYNTVSGKLLRWVNGVYTANIDTDDLTGTIEAEQLSASILQATLAASSLTLMATHAGVPASYLGTDTVYDTTNKKLLTWNGTAYTSQVAAADVTGEIQAAQLAAGSVTQTTLASNLSAITTVTTQPGTAYLGTPSVYFNSKLYTWKAGVGYSTAVDTTDLNGQVQAAQIASQAIDASKFAPNLSAVVTTAVQPGTTYLGSPSVYYGSKLYTWKDGVGYSTAVATTDLVGEVQAAQLASGVIDNTKMAAGLTAIVQATSQPGSTYLGSTTVWFNGQTYSWDNGKYTRAVATVDLVGTINNAQLAVGSVAIAQFANNLAPVLILDYIPGTTYLGSTLVYSNADQQTYRWNGQQYTLNVAASTITGMLSDAQMGAISAAKVAGQITGTQILDGAISTEKMVVGSVSTDILAANAVTAGKLAIGDFTNLITSPTGETNSGWSASVGRDYSVTGWNSWWGQAGQAGSYALIFQIRNNTFGVPFAIQGGEEFYASFVSVPFGGGQSLCNFSLGLILTRSDGSADFPVIALRSAGQVGGIFSEGSYKVPVGYEKAQVFVLVNAADGDTNKPGIGHYASNFVLRRKNTGQLIVDGAITASKVGADAIEAGKIAAGAVNAREIAAGAVTAEKLTVASLGENLVFNGNFTDLNPDGSGFPAGWVRKHSGNAGSITSQTEPGGAGEGTRVLTLGRQSADAQICIVNKAFPVVGGVPYLVEFGWQSVGGIGMMIVYDGCSETQPADGYLGYPDAPIWGNQLTDYIQPIGQDGMHTFSKVVTWPKNIKWVSFAVHSWSNSGFNGPQYLRLSDVKVKRQVVSALIQDGSITTGKLVTDAVTADKVAANSIDADALQVNSVKAGKIAVDAVTAGTVAAGAINTRELAAYAITASKIAVGDFENLVTNGKGETTDGWTGAVTAEANQQGWQDSWWGPLGEGSMSVLTISGRDTYYGPDFPVKAGDEFYAKFLSVTKGGGPGACNQTLGLALVDGNHNVVDWFGIATRPAGVAGGYKATGSRKVTATNVAFARVWFQVDSDPSLAGNNGYGVHTTNLEIRRKNAGELIVDGAITASKVAADAIEAVHIHANAVDADAIQAGAIVAGKLAADSVIAGTVAAGAIQASALQIGVGMMRRVTLVGTGNGVDTSSEGLWFDGSRVNSGMTRGLNLVVYTRVSHQLVWAESFDTYGSNQRCQDMANRLAAYDSNYVVFVWSFDANSVPQNGYLVQQLKRCGASTVVEKLNYRQPYALIGYPGMGESNGLEVMNQPGENGGSAANITTLWLDGDLVGMSGSVSTFSNFGSTMIADGAIVTGKIAVGAVSAEKVAANAINADAVQAGAIVAGKIATDAVTAGTVAAAAINTRELAAGAITAEKLSVASFGAALNSDPFCMDPTAWTSNQYKGNFITAGADSPSGQGAVGTSNQPARGESNRFPLDGNKTYKFSAWYRSFGGANQGAYLRIHRGGPANGDLGSNSGFENVAPANDAVWRKHEFIFRPEGGANYGWIDYHLLWGGSAGSWQLADIRCEEQVGSTLIADGAVTTDKLVAGSVVAGKVATNAIDANAIQAGAIVAGKLAVDAVTAGNIQAGAVSATAIAAGAITSDKLAVVSTGSNLLANGSWEEGMVGWGPGDSNVPSQVYAQNASISGSNQGSYEGQNVGRLSRVQSGEAVQMVSRAIPVIPGQQYRIRGAYRSLNGRWVGFHMAVGLTQTPPTGGFINAGIATSSGGIWAAASDFNAVAINNTAWAIYETVYTIPQGMYWLSLCPHNWTFPTPNGWEGDVHLDLDDWSVSRVITSALIGDGAITTPKLVAGAVKADQLDAGAVVAGKLAADAVTAGTIATNAISAREIQAGAITAEKLTVSNQEPSLMQNPSFEDGMVGWSFDAYQGNNAPWQWTTGGSDGTHCVWIGRTDPNHRAVIISKAVPITAGAMYVLRFKLYVNSGGARAQMLPYVFQHRSLPASGFIPYPGADYTDQLAGPTVYGPTGSWQTFETTFQARSDCSWLSVAIHHWSGIWEGDVYLHLDEFSLRKQITSVFIADGAVTTDKLVAGAVVAGKVSANAIAADQLQANSVVAGKVATDAITAGTVAANAINTRELAAGAITAEKLSIGVTSGENLILNGSFEDGLVGWRNKHNGSVNPNWGTPVAGWAQDGSRVLNSYRNSPGDAGCLVSRAFPVLAGETYVIRMKIKSYQNAVCAILYAGYSLDQPADGYNGDETGQWGGWLGFPDAYQYPVDGGPWLVYERVFTVPANFRWMSVGIHNWSNVWNGPSEMYVDEVSVKRRVTSAVIADGAITTDKLVAGAVVAGKVSANAIAADQLQANAVTAGKIATDAVTAGTVAASAINTRELAAYSITASKLAIGDFENLVTNGNGESADGWSGNISSDYDPVGWPGWWNPLGEAGNFSLTIKNRDTMYGARFPVKDGDEFYAKFLSVPTGGQASVCGVSLGLVIYNAGGGVIGWMGIAGRPVGTYGGYKATGSARIGYGAGVAFAQVWFQIDTSPELAAQTGYAMHTANHEIRRKNKGELIVDGAITASKVAADAIEAVHVHANAIDADAIQANAVTVGKIATDAVTAGTVAAGAINTRELAAGAVTSEKLLVTSYGTALNNDPNMMDGSAWTNSGTYKGEFLRASDSPSGQGSVISTNQPARGESNRFPLDVNKTYKFSAWYRSFGGSNGIGYLRVHRGGPSNGEISYFSSFEGASSNNDAVWRKHEYIFTPEPGTNYGWIDYHANWGGNTGSWQYADIRVEEQMGATLIQNGAITTDKIVANAVKAGQVDANAIGADQIRAGAIVAGKLDANSVTAANIQGGTITGDKIAGTTITGGNIVGGSITADKMSVTSLSALSANLGGITGGYLDLYDAGGDWARLRTRTKWLGDSSDGFVTAVHPNGDSFTEIKSGSGLIQMHAGDGTFRIAGPGFNLDQGGLTISQANVVGELQVAGNAITVPGIWNLSNGQATNFYIPGNGTYTVMFTIMGYMGQNIGGGDGGDYRIATQCNLFINGQNVAGAYELYTSTFLCAVSMNAGNNTIQITGSAALVSAIVCKR